MVKQRMNTLDLACIVRELQPTLVGTRLSNVYDVTASMYVLKFVRGDVKENILVESGIRVHSTKYNRDKPRVPSGFTMKLRKHIRNWRLESLSLIGRDRIVDMCFGTGDAAQHLLIELYAKGNIILTDSQFKIVSLLRTHKEEDVKFAVHETYPVESFVTPMPTLESLSAAMAAEGDQDSTLKSVFTSATSCGPSVVEHCLMGANIRCNQKVRAVKDKAELLQQFAPSLLAAESWILSLPPELSKNVLVKKTVVPQTPAAATAAECPQPTQQQQQHQYEDFSPILLRQFTSEEWEVEYFPSFNLAVDTFFASLETKKVAAQEVDKQKTVESKKDRFIREHRRRVEELENNQALKEKMARLIQDHVAEVEDALTIIRTAIQRGISWEELERVIKVRQRDGHPTANLIHRLALERNCVELLLCEADEDGEEDPSAPATVVEIDIDLSAHANARRYFDIKKQHQQKLVKTKANEEKAIQNTEKKSKRVGEKIVIRKEPTQQRSIMWFEKFHWFITIDGFVVIAGRDAAQNELLIRKYLRRGDLFVHADEPSAPCGIVKNPECKPVPLGALEEAGCMVVCRSKLWVTRTVTSAWWVHHHQVMRPFQDSPSSPTPSSTNNIFTIRGKKNYLTPKPLAMGVALLYRLSETSPSVIAKHTAPKQEGGDLDDVTPTDLIVPTDPSMDDCGPMVRQSSTDVDDMSCGHDALSTGALSDGVTPPSHADPCGLTRLTKHSAKSRRPRRAEGQSNGEGDDSSEVSSSVPTQEGSKLQSSSSRKISPPPTIPAPQQPSSHQGAQRQQQQQQEQAKKSKSKKFNKKYADQDDEDRALAMMLNGNPVPSKLQQSKAAAVEEKPAPKPKKEVRFTISDNDDAAQQQDLTTPPPPPPTLTREKSDTMDDSTFVEKINAECIEAGKLFTSEVAVGDEVLYAIPMCAPLHTVHKYNLYIKLTPGNERKGRAASAAHHTLTHNQQQQDSFGDLKGIYQRVKEDELIQVMVGEVKMQILGSAANHAATTARSKGDIVSSRTSSMVFADSKHPSAEAVTVN